MDAPLHPGGLAAARRGGVPAARLAGEAVRAPAQNLVCTDQYGGPQQALIAGTYKGGRVWTVIGMRNGCDISRAKRLAFLVPGFSANPNS